MPDRTEFTDLREKAGLDLQAAANLIEVSERTAYRYGNGERRPSKLAMRTLKYSVDKRTAGHHGDFSFIDLFSGIGGLRRAFDKAGGHCVFSFISFSNVADIMDSP